MISDLLTPIINARYFCLWLRGWDLRVRSPGNLPPGEIRVERSQHHFCRSLSSVRGKVETSISFNENKNIIQVFGALMRPLSVQVYVKDEEQEEQEEEEEEKCILKLPDGTVHSQSLELGLTESQTQSPSHTKLPLPTITEQAAADHSGVASQNGSQLRLSSKRKGRNRSESENEGSLEGSKSRLGLKSPLRDCKMPRNQSAPHFVLANRNMSTVFTPLSRYIIYLSSIAGILLNSNNFKSRSNYFSRDFTLSESQIDSTWSI